jgi:hypothetical protein
MHDDILLGAGLDAGHRRVALRADEATRHAFVSGASGSGKSSIILAVVLALVRRTLAKVVVVDPKGELADHLLDVFLPVLAAQDPGLRARILVVEPFSPSTTTPLNLLRPWTGVEPNAQAHLVARLLAEEFEDVGPRMLALIASCVRAAMHVNGNLLDVAEMVRSEGYAEAIALHVDDSELRRFLVDELPSEPEATKAALLSRLRQLLAVPAVRRSLCARTCLAGSDLLETGVTVVKLDAPHGSHAAARVLAGLVGELLATAILSRPMPADA